MPYFLKVNSLISYPLIKTALATATGILLQAYLPWPCTWWLVILVVVGILVLLFLLRKWNKGLYRLESLAVWALFLACGAEAAVFLASKVYQPLEGEVQGTFWCEHVEMKEKLVVAEGLLCDSSGTFNVKVVCFTTRSDTVQLSSGYTYKVGGKLSRFQPPRNPFEFDQQAYNEGKGVSAQLILSQVQLLEQADISSFKRSSKSWIHAQFSHIKHPEVKALLIAFTTGDKSGLSSDSKRNFSRAGIMHLLAVSGLHVSLVAGLPLLLLKRARRKGMRMVWFVFGLTTVWLYAWLTGFQASVLRAGTMLSMIGLAQVLGVQTSSINQLGAAATFILLAEPAALFTVGFQLSFSAVAAILLWAPILSRKIKTKYRWLNKILNGLCVSTAAQSGSSPLSIYYFHSFPSLFLLANLIAIPLATLLLYGALVILLLGSFGLHLDWVFQVEEALAMGLFHFSNWISGISFSCVEGLYLLKFEVVALYLFLFAFFHLISVERKVRSFRTVAVLAAVLVGCYTLRTVPFSEMTLFTESRSAVIGIRNEHEAILVATGPYRKSASSGWVNRYGAKVVEIENDTLIESPFVIWKQGTDFGIEQVVFSEQMGQKKSVMWDGVVVRQVRTWKEWKLVVPYDSLYSDTICHYGNALTIRFSSDGLPDAECNLRSSPTDRDRLKVK